jgi:response regulator RpfG family c-di-GMP phosphodiesterase
VQRFELLDQHAASQAQAVVTSRELTEANRALQEQLARIDAQNESLAQLNKALTDNLQHSVRLGLHLLQCFHPTLGNRARRAHEVCQALAETLHLPPEKRQVLEFAAWLHDIGLVAISRDLIRRWETGPDNLKEDEVTVINSHPILGQDLVKFGHHLEEVGVIIRAHHERFDGQGFPDQLRGEEIPWLARLLAVAAGFAEAHLDEASCVEAIKQGSGSVYDPEAVRAFLRALPKASVSRKEREVLLSELVPGMVLAQGIYTPNGLLLIPEDQPLNEGAISKILNHNRINPITQSLLVYC